VGLLAAGIAGICSWFVAKPFLSSVQLDLALPVVGAVHLSTVLLFDLGVYMVVVGATVLMLIAIAHQSLRQPRRALTADDLDEIPVMSAVEADH
jgi:multicomponent K+:H+ antiporter subunit A